MCRCILLDIFECVKIFWLQNSDMFWKPSVSVEADVASCLVRISDGLKGGVKCADDWLATLQKRDDVKEEANR